MVDFGRLFNLPDGKGYRADLEARVKRDGLAPLEPFDAVHLRTVRRLSKDAATRAAGVVMSGIAAKFTIQDFREGRAKDLPALASSLAVDPSTVDAAIGARARAVFADWAESVLTAGRFGPGLREEMREMGRALDLTASVQDQIYTDRAKPKVAAIWERALAGDMLSPDAEAAARHEVAKLGLPPNLSLTFNTKIDHAKQSWAIAHGKLPIIGVPLSLQRGEVAHAVVTATAYQPATRTSSVSYGGPALRVRIAKGLYYRTGHYRVHRQTEEYQKPIGKGPLVVTNKRLLFVGSTKTTSARLDSILHIEPFTNALGVVRSSGKPTTYRFDADDEWFGAILARSIQDATA